MEILKKTKLLVMALLLGLPVASVLNQNQEEANAAMRVGGNVTNKVVNAVRPLMKPPIAPKPTNIPKIPANMISKLNKPTINIPKGNVNQKVTAFNNNSPQNGKAIGPISQRVHELNLTAKVPENRPQINSQKGPVNSAIGSLGKKDPGNFQKHETSSKLNLNSDFKNKLNSIYSGGGPSKPEKKPTNTPGKLNTDTQLNQKLEGIFGGGSSSNKNPLSSNSQSAGSQSVSPNVNPSAPPAPPLPQSSATPNQNGPSNIPDAPPLPPSGAIPPPPPLPDGKKPVVNTQTGGNLQNQLNSKLNSGLNKTETSNRKPLNTGQNSAHDSLIAELNAKFNSKK